MKITIPTSDWMIGNIFQADRLVSNGVIFHFFDLKKTCHFFHFGKNIHIYIYIIFRFHPDETNAPSFKKIGRRMCVITENPSDVHRSKADEQFQSSHGGSSDLEKACHGCHDFLGGAFKKGG